MKGRWDVWMTAGGTLKSVHRAGTVPIGDSADWRTIPVVPCDDEAIERVARELCRQRGWEWESEFAPRTDLLRSAEHALRAAGATS